MYSILCIDYMYFIELVQIAPQTTLDMHEAISILYMDRIIILLIPVNQAVRWGIGVGVSCR